MENQKTETFVLLKNLVKRGRRKELSNFIFNSITQKLIKTLRRSETFVELLNLRPWKQIAQKKTNCFEST